MKYLITLTFFLLPVLVLAQPSYIPLVGIPNVGTGANFSFDEFINALYALSISIAALLAVIKIVIAGVKYMLTDIVTSKGEAKKDIYGALLGLLIVLGAVLILTIINPNLVKVNLTFAPMGEATIGGNNVRPVLDRSQVSSQAVGNNSSIESLTTTNNPVQNDLLIQDCVASGNRYYSLPNNQNRCVHQDPGHMVVAMSTLGSNTSAACTALNGTFTVDTQSPEYGWCSYPKR